MKLFRGIVLTLLAGTLAFGCAEESTLPTNKEFKIGMSQEFENLNPLIMTMNATTYIYSFVNRSIVTMDYNNNWVTEVCTAIPTLENGLARIDTIDGVPTLRATWEIMEGVKWGDGTQVTGKDAWFSWVVGNTETVGVGSREVFDMITACDVDPDNPRKFTFTFDKIRWDFNQQGTFYLLPWHLDGEVFEQHKGTNQGYEKNSLYSIDPTNPGLYCGPYRVSEIKLGDHVTLVKNEHWFGDGPNIEKIVLMYLPDTSTLEANLRAGTIDMISVLGLKFDQASKFEEGIEADNLPFKVNFVDGLVYEHVDLNLDNPYLQDVRVRRALVHAINRDEITKTLFENRQKTAIHNISPVDSEWFTDDPNKIVLYDYSRSKADSLLTDAGWIMGEDGFRYNSDGERLTFSIMSTAGDKTRQNVQVILQSMLQRVGVELTIKNEQARVFFGKTTRERLYDGLAMYAWISSPQSTPKSTLHTESIPEESNSYSGQNTPGWSNPRVDSLIDSMEDELNADVRREHIHGVLYEYTNDVPVIPLYYRANISVTPINLEGYHLTSHQFSSSHHVEYWNLKQAEAGK